MPVFLEVGVAEVNQLDFSWQSATRFDAVDKTYVFRLEITVSALGLPLYRCAWIAVAVLKHVLVEDNDWAAQNVAKRQHVDLLEKAGRIAASPNRDSQANDLLPIVRPLILVENQTGFLVDARLLEPPALLQVLGEQSLRENTVQSRSSQQVLVVTSCKGKRGCVQQAVPVAGRPYWPDLLASAEFQPPFDPLAVFRCVESVV